MQVKELAQALHLSSHPPLTEEVTGITHDSRKVQPGYLYICIKGARVDGHQFIPEAIEKGAQAILCDLDWLYRKIDLPENIVWLGVEDTTSAMARVAAAFYRYPSKSLQLIGITGTNGKTTTAHFIHALLEALEQPTGILGTLKYQFRDLCFKSNYTTPFSPDLQRILREMIDKGAENAVMECSSHALVQHRLDALRFRVGIFTNLTQDHLDYHKSMHSYREAKAILFQQLLTENGIALLNGDDPEAAFFAKRTRGQAVYYGLDPQFDYFASDIVLHLNGSEFTLNHQEESHPVKLNVPGKYNIYNAIAALGALHQKGYSLSQLIQALEKVPPIPGRMEIVTPKEHPFTVVVDYAHTPDSLENLLQSAREFCSGRVLTVFGCGGDRDRGKRPKMGAVAQNLSDKVWVTSDNPRSEAPGAIIDEIIAPSPDSFEIIEDRKHAIETAISQAQAHDILIIAGKGHETYQIIGDQTFDFDDRAVARNALKGIS